MLNPARLHRLKIEQVARHPWVQGVFVEEFPPVTEQWKREAFEKYAKCLDITMDEVTEMIEKQPYGQLGGTFNIELHNHQLSKIALKRSPVGYRVSDNKVISHISSINPSQISTFSIRVLWRTTHQPFFIARLPLPSISSRQRTFQHARKRLKASQD